MAYNEKIADRIRVIIAATHTITEEKKMFAGLCFMVHDKMCVGVNEDRVMIRFNPNIQDEIMEKAGCSPMDFTGKVMRGYAFVSIDVLQTKKQLNEWIQLALDFNPLAKSSKKSKPNNAEGKKKRSK